MMWKPNGKAIDRAHARYAEIMAEAKREYEAWETRYIAQLEAERRARRIVKRKAL